MSDNKNTNKKTNIINILLTKIKLNYINMKFKFYDIMTTRSSRQYTKYFNKRKTLQLMISMKCKSSKEMNDRIKNIYSESLKKSNILRQL